MKEIIAGIMSIVFGVMSFVIYLAFAFFGAVITIFLIGGLYNLIF